MTNHSEEWEAVEEIIRQEQAEQTERDAIKKGECPICGHGLFLAKALQTPHISRIYCPACRWSTPYRLEKTGE